MSYKEFQKDLFKQLQKVVPTEMKGNISLEQVGQINDVETPNIKVALSDSEDVMYGLDAYYELYCDGYNIDNISHMIWEDVESRKQTFQFPSADSFNNENIEFRIKTKKGNAKHLEKHIYTDMGNGLVATYCFAEIFGKNTAAPIGDKLFATLGMTKEELHMLALDNTQRRNPETLEHIENVLNNMISGSDKEATWNEDLKVDSGDMLILSNRQMSYGAAALFYPEVMNKIGKVVGEDYYVLPSSIHEVLIVPVSVDIPASELRDMVRDINETQVQPKEQLSDEVYKYDYTHKKLELAVDKQMDRNIIPRKR
ncbi:hypothetical protein M2454_000789 [Aequitasia blattaphilus]|uniref:DUF5688 family protein n=1 Tax=Aequitasia blattaphilus TaxID=2949332 RepID=A0ABT1E840_9FIRM|nr:DUF5688 family protein [Aequitasia blattaphilus]MCP1101995.1 DUF5688 family protein [Aequitasia blattaphilus]MCR8614635.1 DUF5688 family protein [Aequitasia blattaphilus]